MDKEVIDPLNNFSFQRNLYVFRRYGANAPFLNLFSIHTVSISPVFQYTHEDDLINGSKTFVPYLSSLQI